MEAGIPGGIVPEDVKLLGTVRLGNLDGAAVGDIGADICRCPRGRLWRSEG